MIGENDREEINPIDSPTKSRLDLIKTYIFEDKVYIYSFISGFIYLFLFYVSTTPILFDKISCIFQDVTFFFDFIKRLVLSFGLEPIIWLITWILFIIISNKGFSNIYQKKNKFLILYSLFILPFTLLMKLINFILGEKFFYLLNDSMYVFGLRLISGYILLTFFNAFVKCMYLIYNKYVHSNSMKPNYKEEINQTEIKKEYWVEIDRTYIFSDDVYKYALASVIIHSILFYIIAPQDMLFSKSWKNDSELTFFANIIGPIIWIITWILFINISNKGLSNILQKKNKFCILYSIFIYPCFIALGLCRVDVFEMSIYLFVLNLIFLYCLITATNVFVEAACLIYKKLFHSK